MICRLFLLCFLLLETPVFHVFVCSVVFWQVKSRIDNFFEHANSNEIRKLKRFVKAFLQLHQMRQAVFRHLEYAGAQPPPKSDLLHDSMNLDELLPTSTLLFQKTLVRSDALKMLNEKRY